MTPRGLIVLRPVVGPSPGSKRNHRTPEPEFLQNNGFVLAYCPESFIFKESLSSVLCMLDN